jgi:hypothetical protein
MPRKKPTEFSNTLRIVLTKLPTGSERANSPPGPPVGPPPGPPAELGEDRGDSPPNSGLDGSLDFWPPEPPVLKSMRLSSLPRFAPQEA